MLRQLLKLVFIKINISHKNIFITAADSLYKMTKSKKNNRNSNLFISVKIVLNLSNLDFLFVNKSFYRISIFKLYLKLKFVFFKVL